MRDLGGCLGDHAVRVADLSCLSPGANAVTFTSVTTVTSVYSAVVSSSSAPILLRLTWSHDPAGPTLSVAVNDGPAVLLRYPRGTRPLPLPATSPAAVPLSVTYDLTGVKSSGGYFVAVTTATGEVALAVGDSVKPTKLAVAASSPDAALLARKERVVCAGETVHVTRARFHDAGDEHEIAIRCHNGSSSGSSSSYSLSSSSSSKGSGYGGNSSGEDEREISVSVDGKRVVLARRLRWNFRGNQTIFVDGSPVDVMWDVHGWWFARPPGPAVFLFRARSTLESRLWLEEEEELGKAAGGGFALLVQAYRST